jgi:hypothetical protein
MNVTSNAIQSSSCASNLFALIGVNTHNSSDCSACEGIWGGALETVKGGFNCLSVLAVRNCTIPDGLGKAKWEMA